MAVPRFTNCAGRRSAEPSRHALAYSSILLETGDDESDVVLEFVGCRKACHVVVDGLVHMRNAPAGRPLEDRRHPLDGVEDTAAIAAIGKPIGVGEESIYRF